MLVDKMYGVPMLWAIYLHSNRGGGGGGGALSHITLGQFNKSRCGMVLYIIMTSNVVKILTQHIFCINLITKMYLL